MSFEKDKGFFIPETLVYANKPSNTFLGHISRLSYFDNRGKLVNEKEFPKGDQFQVDNKIVSKFILNKTFLHIKNEYSAFQGFVLYDTERNIEYEISASNFQELCLFGKIDRGEVSVDCIIAFSHKGYPYLLPIESEKYKKALKFTNKNNSTFDGNLKVGHLYSMKKQKEKLLYLGKFRQDLNLSEVSHYDLPSRIIVPISNNKNILTDHKPINKDIFAILREEPEFYKDKKFDTYETQVEFKGVSSKSIFEDIGEVDDVVFNNIKNYYSIKHSNFGLNSVDLVPAPNVNIGDSIFYLLEEDDSTKEKLYFLHNVYDSRYHICIDGYSTEEIIKKSNISNAIVLEKNGKIYLLDNKNFDDEIISEKIKKELLKLSSINVNREIEKKGNLKEDDYYSFDNKSMLGINFIFKSLGKKIEPFKMEIKGHSSKEAIIINNVFVYNLTRYSLSFYQVHNFIK